ncbi:hypothetical protein A3709_19495 [Halioglobus sp. HI00S01]|uniref:hypothetical protein n=1 Tax=Halioglobus sp. HI00S01 TaxID=1822214 RepID=UPI0007C3F4ED|nr:hypothetical protein [Halioglobus sp. HI00S01]KZX57810.1 hypothetical protein A3709_19495 [Halioglobus sp. HI00S01]
MAQAAQQVESVEEFLARGGRVTNVAEGHRRQRWTPDNDCWCGCEGNRAEHIDRARRSEND